jgi:GntR family transcriptional repressor for pyruvate dehydrogenase complex
MHDVAPHQRIEVRRRETTVEATAQALIRYIASHRLKAGDQLPSERQLVEMTGVSRLPLREALCMLKGFGIVEVRHGKGIFVRRLDMAAIFGMLSPLLRTQSDIDVKDIAETRFHIEGAIAELAAAHRSDSNLLALRAALDGMKASVQDRQAFIAQDMKFHQEMALASGNPIFQVFMGAIADLFRELHQMFRDKIEYRQRAIGEHERVLEAVRDRDGSRAGMVMRKHIRNAEKRL